MGVPGLASARAARPSRTRAPAAKARGRRDFHEVRLVVRIAEEHAAIRPGPAAVDREPFAASPAQVDAGVAPAAAVANELTTAAGYPALGREGGRHDDGAKPAFQVDRRDLGGGLPTQATVDLLKGEIGADQVPGHTGDPSAGDTRAGIARLTV